MFRSRKGFTLVELLATIFIVSLVLGISGMFVINTINSSKNKTIILTEANIKKTANTYVKEYPDEVVWDEDENGEQYTCVLVSLLTEKGYLDSENLSEENNYNFIKVVRDSNNNIISEEFVDEGVCQNVPTRVPIPTNEICNDFDDNEFVDRPLINSGIAHIGYTYYDEETGEVPIGNLPGDYPVTLKLKDNNVWSDGTTDDKTVVCTINKRTPNVVLDSYDSRDVGIESYSITMTSNISGDIKIKVSNTDYVSTSVASSYVNANEEYKIDITTLAERVADTYVTITVIPKGEDAAKYYSTSVVHVVSVAENYGDLTPVDIPTTETACYSNLSYTGSSQALAKTNEGYVYINNTGSAISAGTYTVIAKLNDDYKWSDGSRSNKSFDCSIGKRSTDIELFYGSSVIASGKSIGTVYKDSSISISKIMSYYKISDSKYNVPGVITIDSTDYVGATVSKHSSYNEATNSLYKATLKGLKVGDSKKVTVKFTPTDTKNFESVTREYLLTIKNNAYTLTYNTAKNGGTACSPSTKQVIYNEAYGELCTPTKSGYTFMGWYTSATDRTTKVTASTKLTTASNVTIYAHFKKTITITLKSYSGSSLVTDTVSGTMYNNATSVKITLPSFSSYKNSCGTWDKIGWSKSTSAGSSKDYSRSTAYNFSSSMTLYARYEIESKFIYDYNGGKYIPSRYETSYKSASGSSKNMGPWTETVDQDAKRSGYTFLGWYKGSTRKVKPGQTKSLSFDCGETYMISAQWQ